MNTAAALRSTYRSTFRRQIPISSCLFNPHQPVRHVSTGTTSAPPSAEPTPARLDHPTKAKRRTPLSEEQQRFLDSALRVNQAGELAATLIYAAQTPPIIKAHPHLRPLMQHMHAQEAGHLATFNALLARHRVRPTAMYPVWKVAATALGWGTAMLGREAAMACTEAVETEIGTHYNGQVRELLAWLRAMEDKGEGLEEDEELQELVKTLKRIRDEELEHLDTAVGEDAKKAEGYAALNWVVRGDRKSVV